MLADGTLVHPAHHEDEDDVDERADDNDDDMEEGDLETDLNESPAASLTKTASVKRAGKSLLSSC